MISEPICPLPRATSLRSTLTIASTVSPSAVPTPATGGATPKRRDRAADPGCRRARPKRVRSRRFARCRSTGCSCNLRACRLVCREAGRRPKSDRNPHDEFLGPGRFQSIGHVEAEGVVSTLVSAQLVSVDPDRGLPIDGAEMEQHPFVVPIRHNFERAAVPDMAGFLHDARQSRLDRKRHEDLLVEIFRRRGQRALDDCQVPQAVEALPLRADELRAGIFGMDLLGRNLFGPAGPQWPFGRPQSAEWARPASE